ncbi:DUF2934 domain-containing protein [Microvirga makkahensis]|uniref:DUF2934 domain-containing protein n=1 Tax=Microvirga makkahensis TaxID=1128670 RepID=A0A7X3MSB0_9HYPH|nr:DUF2934 domain-containing protein [Microvirga makkahensis]MXQ12323.1 DUF2934 domain-containing protein [Microvirga makkahensis]
MTASPPRQNDLDLLPDAIPRIGLDLGRQIFDEPEGGTHQEGNAGASEDRIRQRAYEIWESEDRSGDPQDHWHRAERELSEVPQEQSGPASEDPESGTASPSMAQVGNRKMPRPKKVSDRSVPDDIEE